MPKIIEVPGFGQVEFPDNMDDAAITKAIQANMIPFDNAAKAVIPGHEDPKVTAAKYEEQEEAAQKEPGLLDFLMGAPRKGHKQHLLSKQARAGLGVVEGVANFASSLPAGVYGPAVGISQRLQGASMEDADRMAGEAMHNMTYEPRTPVGKSTTEVIGKIMNDVGIPLGAVAHTLPPVSRRPSLPRVPKEQKGQPAPQSDIGAMFEEHAKGPQAPVDFQMELPFETTFQQRAEMLGAELGQPDLFGPLNVPRAGEVPNKNPHVPQAPISDAMQGDLPLHNTPEQIAEIQRAGDPQVDMFNDPNAPTTQWRQLVAEREQAEARLREAQAAVEERQRALEEEMARSTTLARNAAERQRQGQAPTGFSQWDASRMVNEAKESAARTRDLNERGQQMGIVEDFGNNDPMSRMPNMRVDENGMPIRADLSIEAQNLENPLQRNLWGDEMPGRTGDGGLPLTRAIDKMPDLPWKDSPRDQAINQLSHDVNADFSLPENPSSGRGSPSLNSGPGRGQRGAVMFPDSPKSVRQKQDLVRRMKAIGPIDKTLSEWTDVTTATEAVELGKQAKDIAQTAPGKQVSSGLNQVTVYHNNPVLKYARYLFQKARNFQNEMMRTYVTNTENGLAKAIQALTDDEAVRVSEILQHRDKHQTSIPPKVEAMMSAREKAFIEAHDRVMDAIWEWNKKSAELRGEKVPEKRTGYTPNILTGDYKSVVLDKDGNAIGFIGVDTPGEFIKAMEHYKKKFPDAKFTADTWQKARKEMKGNQNHGFVYRDMQMAMNLLAKADPDFAKIINGINEVTNESARNLYNFNVHNMFKKGIEGNQGNKAWLSPEKNAQARLDSLVKYIEEAAEYHSLQEPILELNNLQKNSDLQHLKNTFNYLNDYLANTKGAYTHPVGKVVNMAFDNGHNLLEYTPVLGKHLGPSKSLKWTNTMRHKMSQMFMGWFNHQFTAAQLAQPLQTGVPFMELVRQRVGIDNPATVLTSMKNGGMGAMRAFLREHGFDVEAPAPHLQEAYDYGRRVGMFNFSEMEKAYEGHKTKFGRKWDKVAEMNMVAGEASTRPMMFLSFVDMLHEAGYSAKEAIPVAEHLTQTTMIDYHRYERPMMYAGAGVLGQHAGGLTTFKHGYAGQQAVLAQEIGKQKTLRSAAPLAYSIAAALGLSGLTGTMFYSDIDMLFKEFTGKSIAQSYMKNMPEWVKTGAVSAAMGLNIQGKFSSADMVPDNWFKGLAPHLQGATQIAGSLYDAVTTPDKEGLANAAMAVTPNGWKRATEAGVRQDDKGYVLNKNQERLFTKPRSDADWWKAGVMGLTPINEAAERRDNFDLFQGRQHKEEKQKEISGRFSRALRNNASEEELRSIISEYVAADGEVESLLKNISKVKEQQQLSERLRMSGIPKQGTPSQVKKYKDFHN